MRKMKYVLKQAAIEHIDNINTLLRLSKRHWGYDDDFLDRFMQGFNIKVPYLQQHDIKLVYLDNTLIGFFNFIINKDSALELDNFFLHPDYIGKGHGRQMWNLCCQYAEQLGFKDFIIWSDPNAEPFYKKMGCEKIGERPSPTMPNRFPPILQFKLK
jgi:streptomycin 6-kinase